MSLETRGGFLARLIIAFVRHGVYQQPMNVPSAHLPTSLTAEGEKQARDGAGVLQEVAGKNEWEIYPVIDCSTLLRGWQTADIISRRLDRQGLKASRTEQFDVLSERGLGSAANLTVQKIAITVKNDPRFAPLPKGWKSDSHFRLPFIGAESLMDAGKRVATHVTARTMEMAKSLPADTLKIFVGHGAAFRHAAVDLGILTLAGVGKLSMYHCQPVFLERLTNGSWRHIAGDWKNRGLRQEQPD